MVVLVFKKIKRFPIPGRQFQYDRCLEIVQDEEYLADFDVDDIKRNYIAKKSGTIDQEFDLPKLYAKYAELEPFEKQQMFEKNHIYPKKYSDDYALLNTNIAHLNPSYEYKEKNAPFLDDLYQPRKRRRKRSRK